MRNIYLAAGIPVAISLFVAAWFSAPVRQAIFAIVAVVAIILAFLGIAQLVKFSESYKKNLRDSFLER